jgi:hypothetical protein
MFAMLELVAETLNQPETQDKKFKQHNNRCVITGDLHIEYSYKPSIRALKLAHIIPLCGSSEVLYLTSPQIFVSSLGKESNSESIMRFVPRPAVGASFALSFPSTNGSHSLAV